MTYLADSGPGLLLTRARLLYGQWLRRAGRRREARAQLTVAHESALRMGAEAFAARAATELRATGARARPRTEGAPHRLTEQERHIAALVATGATSREIGMRLSLSKRTIDAHLRNIFRKLDITSRHHLRELFAPDPAGDAP